MVKVTARLPPHLVDGLDRAIEKGRGLLVDRSHAIRFYLNMALQEKHDPLREMVDALRREKQALTQRVAEIQEKIGAAQLAIGKEYIELCKAEWEEKPPWVCWSEWSERRILGALMRGDSQFYGWGARWIGYRMGPINRKIHDLINIILRAGEEPSPETVFARAQEINVPLEIDDLRQMVLEGKDVEFSTGLTDTELVGTDDDAVDFLEAGREPPEERYRTKD